MSENLYCGSFFGEDSVPFACGSKSIADVVRVGTITQGYLFFGEDVFGVYEELAWEEEGEPATETEMIGLYVRGHGFIRLYVDRPELDPTKEEAEILENFDKELFGLFNRTASLGCRSELIAIAARENVESWLESLENVQEESDDNNDKQ